MPRQNNVLVDKTGHARIKDFGLATINAIPEDWTKSSIDDLENSLQWTAPEVVNSKPYRKESNIFSFGMLMVEVRYG